MISKPSGKPAAVIRLNYTESLPDGAEVKRAGQFYGIVKGGDIWVIRCMGPEDGSSDADFQAILGSIEIS